MVPPPIPTPDVLKGVDDQIRSALEAFRNACFSWLLVSTGVVVVGLLFELPEIWHESINAIRELMHSCKPERHIPAWMKLVVSLGWLLIVVGVAGEFVADTFVSKADGAVQTFNNILLTEARKETAFAIERAAKAEATASGFQSQIAESNAKAASLTKEAEAERLARVKIQARVAWRHLTQEQKVDIGFALGRFSKRMSSVGIWYNTGDVEGSMFASDIAEALRVARVRAQSPGGIISMRAAGKFSDPVTREDTGVIVQSTGDWDSRSLADAIIEELTVRGFDAEKRTNPSLDTNPIPARVEIMVEARPEGPQGEFKLEAEREAKAKNNK
jgi:hypothetical protein